MNTTTKHSSMHNSMRARWSALHDREKALVRGATIFLSLLCVGWWGIAVPLNALRQAEGQRPGLDAQWRQMQALQAEALALQRLPAISADDASRALQASARQRLGASAQLDIVGGRATLTLRNTPADALAAWLADARALARAVPMEARLARSAASPAGAAAWDGTLVLELPAP